MSELESLRDALGELMYHLIAYKYGDHPEDLLRLHARARWSLLALVPLGATSRAEWVTSD